MSTEANCKPAQEPDKSIAADFLNHLDPERGKYLFAAIDDQKRQKGMLTMHGTLDECWSWICDRQREGWGIFFTVNRTKGAKRKAEDVAEARALFLDVDKVEMPEPVWPEDCPPLIEVVSSLIEIKGVVRKKRHFYWPCDDLDLPSFDIAQSALVERYVENGADKAVKDRPRVLRLPGTLHLKTPHNPHLVTFQTRGDFKSYPAAKLRTAFAPPPSRLKPAEVRAAPFAVHRSPKAPIEGEVGEGEVGEGEEACIKEALEKIPADDRQIWLNVGLALHDRYSGRLEGLDIWDEWSRTTSKDNYTDDGCETAWKGFSSDRAVGNCVGIGTIYKLALKNGWKGTTWQTMKKALTGVEVGLDLIQAPSSPEGEPRRVSPKAAPASRALGDVEYPERSKKGAPLNHWRNLEAALQHMGVTVHYDEFQTKIIIEGFGDHHVLTDATITDLRCALQDARLNLTPGDILDYVDKIARSRTRHPVREYLNEVKWDGEPRVNFLFPRYAGAMDTPLNRAAGAIFMIAAVRRIRTPGEKYDLMVTLEGPEGVGKSKFLRTLATRNEWFSDGVPLGLEAKEMIEMTRGKWIVEIAELSGLSRRDTETVKAQISRQSDTARGAYARITTEVPRQFVLAGSTNEGRGTGYLRSQTGNRRFLPVSVTRCDLTCLKRDLDQLWAEAAHREAEGESIFLSPELEASAREEQEARREVTLVEEVLGDLMDRGGLFISGQSIREALKGAGVNIPGNSTRPIKNAFTQRGWTEGRKKCDEGTNLRGWLAPKSKAAVSSAPRNRSRDQCGLEGPDPSSHYPTGVLDKPFGQAATVNL